MTEKYYLDTSTWMDYYEDRRDPYTNLGEYAFQLLCKLLATRSRVVVSTFLLRELEVMYSLDKIVGCMRPFEGIFEKVGMTAEQDREADAISEERGVPKGDAIHAIIARDNGALLVSRDKHFQQLKDICATAKPEDLV